MSIPYSMIADVVDVQEQQTEATCFQMAMLPTYFLVGIFPIVFYLLSKYKLNREVYIKIRKVLDQRK